MTGKGGGVTTRALPRRGEGITAGARREPRSIAALVAVCGVLMTGCALRYQFVDELEQAAGTKRVSEKATNVAGMVDVSALEPDVRYLASPSCSI